MRPIPTYHSASGSGQLKKLSAGDIKVLENADIDVHELKGGTGPGEDIRHQHQGINAKASVTHVYD